ncbi:MAG: NAD(P)/FAD-dependent oxidoreductase [Gammaproteobacteria bacterium]
MQAAPAFQRNPSDPEIVDIPETLSTDDPTQHRVLIVGGGAAGLELATWLGHRLGRRKAASITLVDRCRTHVWKPLLHEVASRSLDSEVDAIELIPHAVKHGYRYRIGAMYGIDREKRQISVEPSYDEEGEEIIPRRLIGYDTLVIAVGSICNDFNVPGAKEHAIALDTADEAARFNRKMINACLRANAQYEPLRSGQLHCAIVGAGATGVELVAELHKTMRDIAAHGLTRDDSIFAIGDCACCVLPGAQAPVPPRAQSAHQMAAAVYKSIVNRVLGKPPVKFRYQDFGSLVNLSEYGTFGNLLDRLSGRSVAAHRRAARTPRSRFRIPSEKSCPAM